MGKPWLLGGRALEAQFLVEVKVLNPGELGLAGGSPATKEVLGDVISGVVAHHLSWNEMKWGGEKRNEKKRRKEKKNKD